jgi:hypothetical protein
MKPDVSRLRQDILRVEASRAPHVQALLEIRDALLRGSFVTLHRKCGKPSCHCADGDGHPGKYLSIKEGGRTRLIYVGAGDELRVAEGVARQRAFRQSRAELVRLSDLVLQLLGHLERALTQPPPTKPRRRERLPKKPKG